MTSTTEARPRTFRRLPAATLLVSVLGLLDSGYLTFEHFTESRTLACSDSGAVNCLKVTTSSYATVHGAPVAVLGLVYFAAMVVMCLPALWRRPEPWVGRLRLAMASIGILFVLYLVWVELFRLDAICLWCTAAHVLAFALFALIALDAALTEPEPDRTG